MTTTVAIAGKGGTGKTTLAGLLIAPAGEGQGRPRSWRSTPTRPAT